jgi:hypothetical protein
MGVVRRISIQMQSKDIAGMLMNAYSFMKQRHATVKAAT